MIYLDYNATTPLADEVVAAMEPYLRQAFGNASSLHWAGRPARAAIDNAREQVAGLLGCQSTEVVFTSGGTEANNYALKGVFFARLEKQLPTHIITSQIEHPAILEPCRFLESLGAEVTRLPVDRFGLVDPTAVSEALRPHTALISIMHANNEVGTIQPLAEIAAIAHEHGALMHTDAAQSVGKVSTRVAELGVDLLTIAGHKLYAPKGVGALYVRSGVTLAPFMHGAGHEQGRRAGTENILEIVGLGAACEVAPAWINRPALHELRDYFWNSLLSAFGERVSLNGHPERRLPNTLNVNFHGQIGSELLATLPQLAASTGSACHAGSHHLSPVLAAMGVSPEIGLGAIRFSLGRKSTLAQIDKAMQMLRECAG